MLISFVSEEQMVPSLCMKYRSQRELLRKAVMLAQRTQSTQQQHVNSSPSSYWIICVGEGRV